MQGNGLAIRAWNLLSNGMGGIDWAGLPIVAELLAVQDLELLTDALLAIRQYKPASERSEDTEDEDT